MSGCISSTSYTMKADIYSASVTQGAAGEVIRTWVKEETIDCYARGILRKGVGENSTAFEINNYVNILNSMVKVRANKIIAADKRIANIRNDYEIIYKEGQDPATAGGIGGSTIFEPRGSTPITNFDGSIIEYETVLMRQEIQRLDIV
jgi:hypothetical protein